MRNSGIELLKIIAIGFVVIFHVVNTLGSGNPYILYGDYIINLSVATTDIHHFILILFSYFGVLGNTVFFICTAWFLISSTKLNKRKWFFILFEVWVVSIGILLITYIIRNGDISRDIFVRSIFPTSFANNWYITCYLLFYPIHPLLNSIVFKMDKRKLFRISFVLFFLYCCLNFIKRTWFFPSYIILWITLYFLIAYLQLYLPNCMNSFKYNIIILILGFGGYIGIVAVTNILGLHDPFFSNKLLYWATNCNPFLIAISISLFNLMRKMNFKNRIINYISSLSLLIYIIHENIILRTYYRPALWNYVYQKYGYDRIIFWVLVLGILVFTFGLMVSIIYDKTVRRFTRLSADKIYTYMKIVYLNVESVLMKLD